MPSANGTDRQIPHGQRMQASEISENDLNRFVEASCDDERIFRVGPDDGDNNHVNIRIQMKIREAIASTGVKRPGFMSRWLRTSWSLVDGRWEMVEHENPSLQGLKVPSANFLCCYSTITCRCRRHRHHQNPKVVGKESPKRVKIEEKEPLRLKPHARRKVDQDGDEWFFKLRG